MNRSELAAILTQWLYYASPRLEPTTFAHLTPEAWSQWLILAWEQRVAPLLYARMRAEGWEHLLPEDVVQFLRTSYRENAIRNLRYYLIFRTVTTALHKRGIPIIALKGIYLAEAVYRDIALRRMGDIDILVPRAKMAEAGEVVEALGFRPWKPYNARADILVDRHLTRMIQADGLALEIHWNLTSPGSPRFVEADTWWSRATSVYLGGVNALTLSVEDTLLHLCLHAAYQHHFTSGLRPLCDIAWLIERFETTLDWDTVANRAQQWGWERGVYLTLRLTQKMLGATIPTSVLKVLQPPSFPEYLLNDAEMILFSRQKTTHQLPAAIAKIADERLSPFARALYMFKSAFPSPAVLANIYGISPNSPRVYAYYLTNWWHAIQRNKYIVTRILRHDPELVQITEPINRLRRWFEDKN